MAAATIGEVLHDLLAHAAITPGQRRRLAGAVTAFERDLERLLHPAAEKPSGESPKAAAGG